MSDRAFSISMTLDWKQSLLPSMSVEVGGEETLSDETKLLLRIKPVCV